MTERFETTRATPPDPEQEPYVALRTKALESLLIEKGLLTAEAVDERIREFEQDIGPLRGAQVVARAWVDPAFRARLLEAGSAIGELGIPGGGNLVVVENTPDDHHMVVCTLCSCYPWSVLGLPPTWYKSAPYRSRTVIEPKGVLADFGVALPPETEIRIWDSTAETRFLVVPMRPEGTEGWSEEQLMQLVTRDSMIGTGLPKTPTDLAREPVP